MATKITKKIQYATLWSVFIRLLVHFVVTLQAEPYIFIIKSDNK